MAKLVAVFALAVLALLASGAASPQAGSGGGCPTKALPLSGVNPIAPATLAALRRVPAADRPQVTGANWSTHDTLRGPQVRAQCGQRVAARTIVVYVVRRANLPSQSASQGAYFVSRFQTGYRVWQVAH